MSYVPLQRKRATKDLAESVSRARKTASNVGRTGQVPRSSVQVGDEDVALDSVLVGAVEDSFSVALHDESISYLDESDTDSFDTVIDAGGAADVDLVLDAQDADPDLIDEFEAAAEAEEDAHQADMAAIGANQVVDEAMAAAEQAADDALKAKQTADGRNRIYAQAINPVALPDNPFINGDLWYRTETVGGQTRFVEVFMWNGTTWAKYEMVASSVLVPGSVGPVLIENGAVSGLKLAADAIDGKTITGAILRTAASGQRMQFDASGLRAFNASNAVTASISAAAGSLMLSGLITMPTGGGSPAELGAYGIASPLFENRAMYAVRSTGFNHQARDISNAAGAVFGDLVANAEKLSLLRRFDNLSGATRGSFEVQTWQGAEINMVSRATRTSTPMYLDVRPDLHNGYYFIGGGPMSSLRFREDRIDVQGPMQFQGDTDWANATLAPGVTGIARWRRFGGSTYVEFSVTSASVAADGLLNPAFTIPPAQVPEAGAPLTVLGGGTRPAIGRMSPANGGAIFRNTWGSAQTQFVGGGNWLST